MRTLLRRSGYALVARSLRRTFRRVAWVGPFTPPPPNVPMVLYANHHLFHDSYVLGVLAESMLRRRVLVWMEGLERFPFFGLLGALPMPAHSPATRARTVRETARRMDRDPATCLIYYPEGALHPAEEGIRAFPADRFARLDRVLPATKLWWPVALRVSGHHDASPTVYLTAGEPHPRATGHEADVLRGLLARLATPPAGASALLEGRRGPHERWDFRRAAAL